ncbi:MAG: nitroreductase family protein [Phycisphaerales bacterium]|nr:nitroreductase family protein [Phycisphaerales bacterium]
MDGLILVPSSNRYDPGAPPEEALRRFHDVMRRRRSVRNFSPRPVSRETIEGIVRVAASAPSGANKQPWRFVCVQDPALKRQIRLGAEEQERELFQRRANAEWRADLRRLGTDEHKEFLEIAPWLIVVFRLTRGDDGSQVYYASESVGIAVGFLIAAAHHAGLAVLTHTPSPMKFLCSILGRPENERPYFLTPVGYPTTNGLVPAAAIERKPLEQVMVVDKSR